MSGQGFELWCDGYGCKPADLMFVGISADGWEPCNQRFPSQRMHLADYSKDA